MAELVNVNPYLTDAELDELSVLLVGTCARLVWHEDETGSGIIVEFNNGKNFSGVMHPRAALEMLREGKDGLEPTSAAATQ